MVRLSADSPIDRRSGSWFEASGHLRVASKPIRFTRGSRKHRIGRASARHVIDTIDPNVETDDITQAVIIRWVENDERDRELEVIAIVRPACQLVVHVMPTHYRRNP